MGKSIESQWHKKTKRRVKNHYRNQKEVENVEVEKKFGNVRLDVFLEFVMNGERILTGFEMGKFNHSSHKLKERFGEYIDHIDHLVWVYNMDKYGRDYFTRVVLDILMEADCRKIDLGETPDIDEGTVFTSMPPTIFGLEGVEDDIVILLIELDKMSMFDNKKGKEKSYKRKRGTNSYLGLCIDFCNKCGFDLRKVSEKKIEEWVWADKFNCPQCNENINYRTIKTNYIKKGLEA